MLDFYNLGALLYEMLVGIPPHFSKNLEEMYKKILKTEVPIPKCFQKETITILKGLLQKNPNKRLGFKNGVREIKNHPFCYDIDWESIYQKKLTPPIQPFLSKSNFDPQYTNQNISENLKDLHEEDYSDEDINNYLHL